MTFKWANIPRIPPPSTKSRRRSKAGIWNLNIGYRSLQKKCKLLTVENEQLQLINQQLLEEITRLQQENHKLSNINRNLLTSEAEYPSTPSEFYQTLLR